MAVNVAPMIPALNDHEIPAIMDATNLEERHRERLYHIADQAGAKLDRA